MVLKFPKFSHLNANFTFRNESILILLNYHLDDKSDAAVKKKISCSKVKLCIKVRNRPIGRAAWLSLLPHQLVALLP